MALAQQRQDALLTTIIKSNDSSRVHSKYLTNLRVQKEKIKTDLQVYTPRGIDIQVEQVSQDLNEAIQHSKDTMKLMAQNVERTFKKRLLAISKKATANHTETELVCAIDEANKAIDKLTESTHLSEVHRLKRNHDTKKRISDFLESDQLRTMVDEQTEAGINDYLNKNPERLNFLISQHIANSAGTNDAIDNLVTDTAQTAVDDYFRNDDNPYLKNFVERVSHRVVAHHLTPLPPLATEMSEEPPHPEQIPQPTNDDQNQGDHQQRIYSPIASEQEQIIPQEQENATIPRHPRFQNVRFTDDVNQIQDQGGNRQGIYRPIASENIHEDNQSETFRPISSTSMNNYRQTDNARNNAGDTRGGGRGRGRFMPIYGLLVCRRPAGGFGSAPNSTPVNSTSQKNFFASAQR